MSAFGMPCGLELVSNSFLSCVELEPDLSIDYVEMHEAVMNSAARSLPNPQTALRIDRAFSRKLLTFVAFRHE